MRFPFSYYKALRDLYIRANTPPDKTEGESSDDVTEVDVDALIAARG